MSNSKNTKKTVEKQQNTKKASKSSAKASKNKKKLSLKKKTVIFLVADILLIFIIGGAVVFNLFDFKNDFDFIAPSEFVDDIDEYEDSSEANAAKKTLNELRDTDSLSALLKEWATNDYSNDTIMEDKNVLNFLLVGVDKGGGNSDVMMLMSLNKKTKKIYLTSFMRDSYTYIKTAYGEKYAKLNAAYANGGINCLIDTVQRDYRIKIDNYFLVNFNTFKEIIDIMGGVNVKVQPYEANAAGLPESGDNVCLNGEQALSFCRIRKCDVDGDVSRTRRQRQVIAAVINKSKSVKANQIDDILDSLFTYVRTDCSTTTLFSLATQGLFNKWYDYEIVSKSLPLEKNRMDYSGASWVWIVDYPADAKALQESIYGYSNISLNEDRVTAIQLMRSGKGGI